MRHDRLLVEERHCTSCAKRGGDEYVCPPADSLAKHIAAIVLSETSLQVCLLPSESRI
jgi:hypothetical protein